MVQSEIIFGIYNAVEEKVSQIKYADGVKVSVRVNDLCQCMFDKSGQRIVVNDQQYEQPAAHSMCIGVVIEGKSLSDVLKTYGKVSVYFKDNPSVNIADWKWHGCADDKSYLEPVVRKLDLGKKCFDGQFHKFELLYTIDFSLNSQKPNEFKRVEKRDIRGYVKK